jgi:hypothetical protein
MFLHTLVSPRRAARLLPAVLLGACTTATSYPTAVLRPADGAPEHFVLEGGETMNGAPGGPCRSPIRDPRGGAPLVMVRAYQGSGDYDANGRFGTHAGELVRVDCASGAPLGIVRG